MSHSVESGMLEQGQISNMQTDQGYLREILF